MDQLFRLFRVDAAEAERIAQAPDDWRAQRFDPVPGETEFIPLP